MYLYRYRAITRRLYENLKREFEKGPTYIRLISKAIPTVIEVGYNGLSPFSAVKKIVRVGGLILRYTVQIEPDVLFHVIPKYFPDAHELVEFVNSQFKEGKRDVRELLNIYDIERGTDYYELIDNWFISEGGSILLCYRLYYDYGTPIYACLTDDNLYISNENPNNPKDGDPAVPYERP